MTRAGLRWLPFQVCINSGFVFFLITAANYKAAYSYHIDNNIVDGTDSRIDGNCVTLSDQRIDFPTTLGTIPLPPSLSDTDYTKWSIDAQYVFTICQAVNEYILYCIRDRNEYVVLQALVLLFAIKNTCREIIEEQLGDTEDFALDSSSCELDLSSRLWRAARQLATQHITIQAHKSNEPNRLFFWAVANGHTAVAIVLLEYKGQGVVDEQDLYRWVSLHDAASNGWIKQVRFILSEEPEGRDSKKSRGYTAFELSAGNGWNEVLKEPLAMGAVYDNNQYNDNLSTPQHAAGRGHEEVVITLLKAGFDVNHTPETVHGRTELQAAAQSGDKMMVERLLQAGAEVNAAPSEKSYKAAKATTRGGYAAIRERQHDGVLGVDVAPPVCHCYTILQRAALQGNEALVERPPELGAIVNAPAAGLFSRTALQAAAERGHEGVVERLLGAGANVNAEPAVEFGRTALQAATGQRSRTIVRVLLGAGAAS